MKKALFCLSILLLLISCSFDTGREQLYHIGLMNYSGSSVCWRVWKNGDPVPDEFEMLTFGAYHLSIVEPETEYLLQFGESEDNTETVSIFTHRKCNEVHFRMEKSLVCQIISFSEQEATP